MAMMIILVLAIALGTAWYFVKCPFCRQKASSSPPGAKVKAKNPCPTGKTCCTGCTNGQCTQTEKAQKCTPSGTEAPFTMTCKNSTICANGTLTCTRDTKYPESGVKNNGDVGNCRCSAS